MTRKLLSVLIAVACIVVSLGASCAKPAPSPVVELSLADFDPEPAVFVGRGTMPFSREIEERSGGRIKIINFNNASLGPIADHYKMAATAICDIARHLPCYTPGVFPLTSVLEIPGLSIPSAVVSSRTMAELYEIEPAIREEYKEVKVLYWPSTGPRPINTKKPVHNLGELKGMKIGVISPTDGLAIRSLGASPIQIPAPDMYMSLDRGIVDGIFLSMEGVLAFKLNDIVKYVTAFNFANTQFVVVMNQNSWESLPPDLQEVVEEVSTSWNVKGSENADMAEEECLEVLKKTGTEVITFSPEEELRWLEKLEPLTDQWVEDMEGKGLPGRRVLREALELIEKYK